MFQVSPTRHRALTARVCIALAVALGVGDAFASHPERPTPLGMPRRTAGRGSSSSGRAGGPTPTRRFGPAPGGSGARTGTAPHAPHPTRWSIRLDPGRMDFGPLSNGTANKIRQTVRRIGAGQRLSAANDGAYFRNAPRSNGRALLPQPPAGHDPATYYREFYVHTDHRQPVGGQRLIVGRLGEVYFSGDHYGSARLLAPARAHAE